LDSSTCRLEDGHRIFIRSHDRVCQLFRFSQHKDGSIYCSSPDFGDAVWLSIESTPSGLKEIRTENVGDGKISLHGTGMVAVRAHDQPENHQLVVKGNYLLNKEKNAIGARHLFTAFIKEPKFVPETSPIFNRASDYCLEANEQLKPLILVFFAVPQHGIHVNFNCSFHQEDLVNIPNDVLGLHGFGLRYHDVFWFAYRTKHLEKWPKQAQICYHDGYTFPLFIGTGTGTFRLEYRFPVYSLNGKDLSILCHADYPDDYSNTGNLDKRALQVVR
jgi:hypothetical protein